MSVIATVLLRQVIVCAPSLLLSVPREGCNSWLWHFLGFGGPDSPWLLTPPVSPPAANLHIYTIKFTCKWTEEVMVTLSYCDMYRLCCPHVPDKILYLLYCTKNMSLNLFQKIGVRLVITKTSLFKYTENLTTKNWKFSDKKIWYFSYFFSKHRLWILVRTASPRRF